MPAISTVRVTTSNASRYLQQLCKHWSHNLVVTFDPTQATVTFPRNVRGAAWPADARLTMQADAAGLDCRLEAGAAGQLAALKGAVARHLDRFAFREAPLRFDWQDQGDLLPAGFGILNVKILPSDPVILLNDGPPSAEAGDMGLAKAQWIADREMR